ncbi:MAG TPA: protein kinase [Acidobacteriota bacterium]|nr:protein kinase [Acidobacteriota bacterium]
MAKTDKDPYVGSRIREYQILESIGRGGMGAVYRARHIYLDKERAIKVVHRSLTESQDFVQRFIREAKLLSNLNHPNVVQLYDFGMLDENTFFMVMELIKGQTVIDRIQQQTRIPSEDSIRIIREAALGLGSAHRKGIIHRDISPDNLILVPDSSGNEITKVVDFGIAKPLHEDTGRFTMTNFFIGKPEYSSPEQCGTLPENENLDERSDIYSLGVTFYQMITGRLPFVASTPQGYLLKHAQEVPQSPSAFVPYGEIAPALDQIVMKALRKKREDRHRNLDEFIAELDHISLTEGPTMASLDRQSLLQRQITRDQTLRVDRDAVLPLGPFSTQDLDEINAPTEKVATQKTIEEFPSTTPLRPVTPRPASKSSGVGFAVLLSAALFVVVVAAAFYFYKNWSTEEVKLPENTALNDAEQALNAGDDKKAEELLKQAELQKRPEDEQRLNRLRDGIAAIRKQRQIENATLLVKDVKQNIAARKLEEASSDLDRLRALNLPEFQNDIDSLNSEIETLNKTVASQKHANEMLDDVRKALETGNIELSESKLKAFKSGKFPGFEQQKALLEQKIAEAKQQADLAEGNKLLDEAERFIQRENLNSATERIKRAEQLQLPALNSRIDSLSARLNSLQKSNAEAREKVQSLLNTARLLIQVGQTRQAQEWISQARSLNVPEFKDQIDSLSAQIKTAQHRTRSANALDAAAEAVRRGDWIEADRALNAARKNPPEGSAARIEELNRQVLSIRPYVGFGVKRKWEADDTAKHGVPFGAVVAKIDRNSPADRAGLRRGDVIVEYNGSILVDDNQLPWFGAYSKPGSEVVLKILRDGERRTIRIQVISMLANQS